MLSDAADKMRKRLADQGYEQSMGQGEIDRLNRKKEEPYDGR